LILYIICFFGCLVPLCYLPPHRSAAEVFGTFQNLGDWDTMALAFFVGWWPSLSAFVGKDLNLPKEVVSVS
jgi:choline transport protein